MFVYSINDVTHRKITILRNMRRLRCILIEISSTAPELFNEIERAKIEGEYDRLLKKYHSRDLLIIDDWLLYPVKEGQCEQILEVLEGRYRHSAKIVGSQYAEDGWRERLGGSAVAEAIMDRLTACAERIMILGDKSMRTRND